VTFDLFLTAFVTIFLIIDPIGLLPFFIALTSEHSKSERRIIALRSTCISLFVLVVFAVAGDRILQGIGIGMPAFRIAGGVLLFMTAVDMLFEKRAARRESQAESADKPDPSVFPLATPLIAGPGAIAAVILLAGQGDDSIAALTITLCALLGVMVLVLALFTVSGAVERLLGKTGIAVITRLLGMLLAALAVQFVVDGMHGLGVI
jgi:multiple antibiotic resistance protein